MKVVILGGGIGGLTTALALLHHGIEPIVLERAPLMVAVRTRTLHGGVDQKRETTPVLQNCSVLAVDGIDVRYRVRRKEPEGRVQTHQARRVSGGGDAGVWMR
jgi:2-polyprenyl-6-methoxyphenol hydroxylase-like FAD-dependent oxidoreductase